MRTRKWLVTGLLTLIIVASACVSPTTPPPTGTVSGARGSATVALAELATQQFDIGLDNIPGMYYYGPMYDGILGINPDGSYGKTTGVVENWEYSADFKELTLRMRQGIKFHDGSDATAEDLAFSLQRLAAPNSNAYSKAVLANASKIEATGPLVVKLTLKVPDASLLPGLSLVEGDALLAKKSTYKQIDNGFALIDPEHPIGSGPFKFKARKIGEFVAYEAFDGYWNPQRRAGFKDLTIRLIVEPSTRMSAMRTGEVDVASLNPDQLDSAKGAGFKVMGPQKAAIPLLLFYASYDPAFLTNKLEFRKALILAYDKKAIVNRFYPPEVGTLATGSPLFSPLSLGWDATLPAYPYDPEEAKRLLKVAGYDGRPLKVWAFPFGTAPENPQVLEAMSSYWRAAGITVEFTPTDFPSFRPRLFAKPQQFDTRYAGHVGIQVPITAPSVLNGISSFMASQKTPIGVQATYWNGDRIDSLRPQLGQITDPKKLDDELRNLNRQLYQEYWADQIVWRNVPFAVSSKVCGWTPANGTGRQLELSTLRPC